MNTIAVSKIEYQTLIEKSLRYEYLRQIIEEDIFASPPVKDIDMVIDSFKETKRYNKNFLNSLKKGLKKSSYFKK